MAQVAFLLAKKGLQADSLAECLEEQGPRLLSEATQDVQLHERSGPDLTLVLVHTDGTSQEAWTPEALAEVPALAQRLARKHDAVCYALGVDGSRRRVLRVSPQAGPRWEVLEVPASKNVRAVGVALDGKEWSLHKASADDLTSQELQTLTGVEKLDRAQLVPGTLGYWKMAHELSEHPVEWLSLAPTLAPQGQGWKARGHFPLDD